MERKLCIILPIILMVALCGGNFGLFNRFPPAPLEALTDDAYAILYSIDPSDGPAREETAALFHRWPILGQTVLRNPADRQKIADNLRRAARGAWDMAACFDPRQGVSAVSDGGTHDILICFECGRALVFFPSGETKEVPIGGGRDTLNQFLTAAGLPISKR